MKITEARLKELITEEVNAYLEEGWKKNLAALGIGAGMALGAGEIQKGVDARDQELSDQIAANVADAIEKDASHVAIMTNMKKESKNVAKFMWHWEQDLGGFNPAAPPPPQPLLLDKRHGSIGVLPPEFGVFLQAKADFDLNETPRYTPDNITAGADDYKQNRKNFPERWGLADHPEFERLTDLTVPPEERPKGVVSAAVHKKGFKQHPSAGGVSEFLYLLPDKLPEDYVMPMSAQTKSEYYNEIWNTFVEKPRKRLVDNPPQ